MSIGVRSTIHGAKETRSALRKYAPDVLKALDKEVSAAVAHLVTAAKSEIPETPPTKGWSTNATKTYKKAVYAKNPFTQKRTVFAGYTRGRGWPNWQGGEIYRGIKKKQGRKRKTGYRYSSLVSIYNSSAAGSIFEVAGRKNRGVPGTRGFYFIDKLNRSFGHASRVIWRAIDEGGTEDVQRAVEQAYRIATAQLEVRLDLASKGVSTSAQADAFESLMRGK